jgi:hypothetical protein
MYRIGPSPYSDTPVVLAIRFREFAGTYVEHCHNTQHEDHAMLLRWDLEHPGQFLVMATPLPTWDGVEYVDSAALPTFRTVELSGTVAGLPSDNTTPGNDVTLTAGIIAGATGVPAPGTFQYEFQAQGPDGTFGRSYSTNNTWVWDNTILYPVGAYEMKVNVRQTASPNTFLGTATLPFTLSGGPTGPKSSKLDFDNDGKTDLAVFRPSDSIWYVLNSSNSAYTTQSWGLSTDNVVPGDYDGDGKTDYAVWRPSSGTWFVLRSSDGVVASQQWGQGSLGDITVPGDYDGDGKTDYAVWRPSSGTWFVLRSSDGVVVSQQWGQGSLGDIPLKSLY